ncbi:glutathione S-transferase family protein [Propylenella binzhouense]|nr:glutathione S-transferase family protein [Propylenella binzhouense]
MPLTETSDLVLYHAPRSRSFRILWFLEELGVPYALHRVSLEKGEQKSAEFLKLNPSGKVPAITDRGAPVAESGAIVAYLAERYGNGRFSPAPGDPDRGAYLQWLFYAVGVMEPCFGEKFFKWDVPARQAGWGDFATMERVMTEALAGRTWILGDAFTAADILIGSNLHWGVLWHILPSEGPIGSYADRCRARPAFLEATRIDEELAAQG